MPHSTGCVRALGALSQAQEQTELPNEIISQQTKGSNTNKCTQDHYWIAVTTSGAAWHQITDKNTYERFPRKFPRFENNIQDVLHMTPKKRDFSGFSPPQQPGSCWFPKSSWIWARIVLVPKKLMDMSCPFSLSSLLLFARFSPKISLGHAYPLPCQHPCTRRKFHIYMHKKL